MKNLEKLKVQAKEYALKEIETYGLPTITHFELSLSKAVELSLKLGANADIAYIGACLMDIKLGQAFSEKKLMQHVSMGVDATIKFLTNHQIDNQAKELIINCVAAHHGKVPYLGIEAEIAANADCYRFIHPKGVLDYLNSLSKRNLSAEERVKTAELKLEEKYNILSLPLAKEELEDYYSCFKKIFIGTKD